MLQAINLVGVPPGSPPSVFAKEVTANNKIGPVSTTHVSQGSCPDSCPLLHSGCYAENGYIGMSVTRRLNAANPGATAFELALEEVAGIDQLSGRRPLRLHVVGDSTTPEGTLEIVKAVRRYRRRGFLKTGFVQPAWTYTHAWRDVPREAWGPVSVLASCETKSDVLEARKRGYAAAIVVTEHGSDKLYDMNGLNVLPCPEQTRGVKCTDCRLCWKDSRLLSKNLVIGFAAHGGRSSKKKAQEVVMRQNGSEYARGRIRTKKNLVSPLTIRLVNRPPVISQQVIPAPVGKSSECSVGWCTNDYGRRCGTCARRFCLGHLCDDHEMRGLAYRVTPDTRFMTRQEEWMYSLRTGRYKTASYMWHCRRCETRGEFKTKKVKKASLVRLAAEVHWEQNPSCNGAGPLLLVRPKTVFELAASM